MALWKQNATWGMSRCSQVVRHQREGCWHITNSLLIIITMTPYFHDAFISKHLEKKEKRKKKCKLPHKPQCMQR